MKFIETKNAPEAIGPYSQAVQIHNFIYTSGQIPLTPSGELIEPKIDLQTEQVLKNISSILEAAGVGLDQVIKTTVFLKDIDHFPIVNQIYEQYFGNHRPARSCVEVSRLPKDVLIEIEVIALNP